MYSWRPAVKWAGGRPRARQRQQADALERTPVPTRGGSWPHCGAATSSLHHHVRATGAASEGTATMQAPHCQQPAPPPRHTPWATSRCSCSASAASQAPALRPYYCRTPSPSAPHACVVAAGEGGRGKRACPTSKHRMRTPHSLACVHACMRACGRRQKDLRSSCAEPHSHYRKRVRLSSEITRGRGTGVQAAVWPSGGPNAAAAGTPKAAAAAPRRTPHRPPQGQKPLVAVQRPPFSSGSGAARLWQRTAGRC